jgi:hypothetical protein
VYECVRTPIVTGIVLVMLLSHVLYCRPPSGVLPRLRVSGEMLLSGEGEVFFGSPKLCIDRS